ncbi:HAD family phosphatase [Nitrospira sp. KM1]|uniref:HAD family hydrolase n=1 Tax=Nitrospira sp. KM1 TaxID=1936990 RepID=UPI001566D9B0|nr:HAD-IB family hydrolase [Nitrospira sp. KM1]
MTSVAALFDVDNTLLPGQASEIRFFRYLWRKGFVGWLELKRSVAWVVGKRTFSIHPLRERKLYLAGKHRFEIEAHARDFFRNEMVGRVSSKARDRLDAHRQAGHHLILVTAAPDFLIIPLAELLNVPTLFAARLERLDGVYTGRVLPPLPYGRGKQELIVAHAREKDIDLKNSFAYGDSPGDVELLESVGYPVVVNPIRGMRQIASRRSWPVVGWNS